MKNVSVYTHCSRAIKSSTTRLNMRKCEQGIKINYGKSNFGVLGQSEQWKLQAASYLNCRIMPLPFSYLGIPIGANPEEVPIGWWP